ncbi:unnamed protein product [Prorocentrum cordatum]|uniref:J domain-containing protein n=1 Tax=Prorocentrum cordatum TaxID=2364126 RepID=A0ABN9W6G8_9DINO|nr:unnamed protein product [Polarella glacialis]
MAADDQADNEDFYTTLGVDKDACDETIRRAYLKSALRWHPDKNLENQELAESMFKKLARAYKVLSDAVLRAIYDGSGKRVLGKDWWPDDATSSRDMAYMFFLNRVPGRSPRDGFSEAKLREIFPELFGRERHREAEGASKPVHWKADETPKPRL